MERYSEGKRTEKAGQKLVALAIKQTLCYVDDCEALIYQYYYPHIMTTCWVKPSDTVLKPSLVQRVVLQTPDDFTCLEQYPDITAIRYSALLRYDGSFDLYGNSWDSMFNTMLHRPQNLTYLECCGMRNVRLRLHGLTKLIHLDCRSTDVEFDSLQCLSNLTYLDGVRIPDDMLHRFAHLKRGNWSNEQEISARSWCAAVSLLVECLVPISILAPPVTTYYRTTRVRVTKITKERVPKRYLNGKTDLKRKYKQVQTSNRNKNYR